MASICQDTQDMGTILWSLHALTTASDRHRGPPALSATTAPLYLLAHLRVRVCTGGCPFIWSEPCHRTLITPLLRTAEPPHSSPGNINDGTACLGHGLLGRHAHRYPQHERRMCRLQEKCPHTGSHTSSPHHTTLYLVWGHVRGLLRLWQYSTLLLIS